MRQTRVIILGAGRPYQGFKPSALIEIDSRTRVLDWVIDAFQTECDPEFFFVGGYHFQEIAHRYPQIHFAFNPNWQNTGSARSLLYAPLPNSGDLFVVYSDVLIRRELIKDMLASSGDLILGVDKAWRARYTPRTQEDMKIAEKVTLEGNKVIQISREIPVGETDGEFVGVLRLNEKAVQQVREIEKRFAQEVDRWDLPKLIQILLDRGLEARAIDVQGHWSELNAAEDIAHFVLGTKAETLKRLRSLVKHSSIGQTVSFTVQMWKNNRSSILQEIQSTFPGLELIIRSSATSEDKWDRSNAGNFVSILNVPSNKNEMLDNSINQVIQSYGDQHPAHQVLIQAMVRDVIRGGVILTRMMGTGAPYITINFEDSADTDAITSGRAKHDRTLILHRSRLQKKDADDQVNRLLVAVQEIENLLGYDALDIEFAQTEGGQVHIFQVRPIALGEGARQTTDEDIESALTLASEFHSRRKQVEPSLLGNKAVFGIMPDWNPAEIIGTNACPLAISLYQYLILDDVWARQRAEYGYRDVRPQPLLVTFAGHPYVDVRASFTSFVPARVPDELASRLVDHYLDRLLHDPELHDKVEFEIAFTCLYFDFLQQANERLKPAGFTTGEIRTLQDGLMEVTLNGIQRYPNDLRTIQELEERFFRLKKSTLSPIDRAFSLLEDCREQGTLPFAHLARGGFVAMTLLRSLERLGVIGSEQLTQFINSLNTITRKFELDGIEVADGHLGWNEFIDIYGHLRPGTYEITSPNYAQDPELFMAHMVKPSSSKASLSATGEWTGQVKNGISKQLDQIGLPNDISEFTQFLRSVITGREYSKFAFSRNLSSALESIAEFGLSVGLDREQLSFIPIHHFLTMRTAAPYKDLHGWLTAESEAGQEAHKLTQATVLPPLISTAEDFFSFEIPSNRPNFVSKKRAVAPVANLTESARPTGDFTGKIVLILQADPGYDWLFGKGIAGLVTAYGGANSHMTIRAAELNLPAAIGVGENLLAKLATAKIIDLDCIAKRINVVE